ncbi:MAG: hypothetical protein JST92_19565 [Deltaproteobacteria bacterium]|nr:hypothetical protein [Deltaproteobacteria bacterium]
MCSAFIASAAEAQTNICASNTDGRTSACGLAEGGCHAWTYGFDPPPWVAIGDPASPCCYDPTKATCTLGEVKDTGAKGYLMCPTQHPYTTDKLWPCGLSCLAGPIKDMSECTYDTADCSLYGYSNLCGLQPYCANSCTQTCEQQGKLDCNGHCYDPQTQRCVSGTTVCSASQDSVCNGKCYASATQHCVSGKVCSTSQDTLCNGACMNSRTQHCLSGTICPLGDNAVCGGVCINTAANKCISGEVCDLADDGVCGGACFDAAVNSCPDGDHLCGPRQDSFDKCTGCFISGRKAFGASCFQDAECQKGKCSGFSNPYCSAGTCQCAVDGDCASGQFCYTGVATVGTNECKDKHPNGDACDADHQCASGRCNWFTCQACTKDSQCSGGTTCHSGVCR